MVALPDNWPRLAANWPWPDQRAAKADRTLIASDFR
jgi:hypothetical protein